MKQQKKLRRFCKISFIYFIYFFSLLTLTGKVKSLDVLVRIYTFMRRGVRLFQPFRINFLLLLKTFVLCCFCFGYCMYYIGRRPSVRPSVRHKVSSLKVYMAIDPFQKRDWPEVKIYDGWTFRRLSHFASPKLGNGVLVFPPSENWNLL